jgi:predicted RNase H-like HicB family nuclease
MLMEIMSNKSNGTSQPAFEAKDYAILVFYSQEDECWIADVPDVQYCSAFGNTPEEAVKEIQIALQAWLEVAQEDGLPIPEPKYRRTAYPVAS